VTLAHHHRKGENERERERESFFLLENKVFSSTAQELSILLKCRVSPDYLKYITSSQ
jgi:hypothetical protein